jgi:S-adenosylmethionine hydrolase
MLINVSNTFHGRDIFTPVAAHILNGIYFEDIGRTITDFVDLNFGVFEINDQVVIGKIIYIDSFGNIITNIDGRRIQTILDYNKIIKISIGKKQKQIPFVKSYDLVKKGEMLATIGSSNYLEISINQGNAAKNLNIKPDDEIKILLS